MASSDILHLTDAVPTQAKFAIFNGAPIDSSKGLSITFDLYAYGGVGGDYVGTDGVVRQAGGDGIAFLLIDGSQFPTQPGGYGGSLGYAPLADHSSGIAGGYLAVAADEFGNFSSGTEGRVGGQSQGRTSNSIAIRGSQETNYKFLTGTSTLPLPISNTAAGANRDNSRHKAEIDLSPTGLLTVKLDLNNDGDFDDPDEVPVNSFDVVGAGNGALPSTFRFAFSASTGGSTNIHEIGNYAVTTFDKQPIAGSFTQDLVLVGGSASGISGGQPDILTGGVGNDILIGGSGSIETGGGGTNRFVFRGASKAEALRSSTARSPIRITDFNERTGDRFQLDFDNNLNTQERPKRLFNAGVIKASNLSKALKAVYADKLPHKSGNQFLKRNEATFFKLGKRTYLSVNDNRNPFSAQNDLVAEVSGIQFKAGDPKKTTLRVSDYFA